MRSRASLAIVPAQDVLGLGSEARMNRPGEDGNWSWRLEPGSSAGRARRTAARGHRTRWPAVTSR